MFDGKYFRALSHLVLAAVAGWCLFHELKINNKFTLLHGLMALHFGTGVLGVLQLLADLAGTCEYDVRRLYETVYDMTLVFGFPLAATQLYLKAGYKEIGWAHLGFAAIVALNHLRDNYYSEDDLMGTMLMVNVISAGGLSIHKKLGTDKYYMIGCFVLTYFGVGRRGSLLDIPSRDLLNYGLAGYCYLALKALK